MANATRTRPPRHRLRWFALATVVVVALVGGGLWWYLRDDAPAAVDLQATEKAVTQQSSTTAANGTATGATGIDGTWKIDTSVGTFTVSGDATSTYAGFRVAEVLSGIGSTTAVGRSPKVSGTVAIAGQQVTAADITVDLTAIKSNESRREGPIQQALRTSTNPNATFKLTKPVALGPGAANGEQVSVTATGNLTINGTTRQVDLPLQAKLTNGKVLITGSLPITFADYGVSAPTAPIVVSVEDHGTLELQLWLSP